MLLTSPGLYNLSANGSNFNAYTLNLPAMWGSRLPAPDRVNPALLNPPLPQPFPQDLDTHESCISLKALIRPMASNTPTYVFVVVISTDERKNGGTEMVDTCGVFESVDDANDEAKSLLAEQYDGLVEAGFIERWTDDDNNTISYDYAGCLKMFDYPEEVCK